MQQVADRAQVSISTVSFVINDTKPVTASTRERVLRAIDELGYRRNAVARALASRRSHIIALIYPLLDSRNHHAFIDGAATVCAKRGYSLVVWPIHSDNASTEIASLSEAGFADGVLLMEVQLQDERVDHLKETGARFALIGRTDDVDGIDYADMDFEHTVSVAVDDLVHVGHRHFTLVVEDHSGTPLAGYAPPLRAQQSFEAAMIERGVHGQVLRIPPRSPATSEIARDIVREAAKTTAVLSMHDEATMSLMIGLRHLGIQVPTDLSVVGIATSASIPQLVDPVLTAYDAPGTNLGGRAATALIDRLEGFEGPPSQVRVTCPLQPGASVAPPAPGRPPLDALVADYARRLQSAVTSSASASSSRRRA